MTSGNGTIEVIQEYWDIDKPSYYRPVGTDNEEYLKLYQQGGFNAATNQINWTFRNSDLNSYYLYAESFLVVTFKISDVYDAIDRNAQSASTSFSDDIRTIFKYTQLEMNSVTIESNNNSQWIWANVDRSFMSKQYVEHAGSLMGYFPDSLRWDFPGLDGAVATVNPTGYATNTARWTSYARKRALGSIDLNGLSATSTTAPITLRIAMPDLFQFFRFYTKVLRGIDVTIKLQRQDSANALLTTPYATINPATDDMDDRNTFDWVDAGIVWWVKTVKPSPRVEASLNAMFQQRLETFTTFEQARVYNYPSTGTGGASVRVTNESSRPTKVICCWQRNSAQTTMADDVSTLQWPSPVTGISLFINGRKVPAIDVLLNAPADGTGAIPHGKAIVSITDMTEPYQRMLEMAQTYNQSFKSNYSRGGAHQNLVEWQSKSPFVVFDLSANAIGDISGSNSEIVVTYTTTGKPTPTLDGYTLYTVVYTERTVSLNLSSSAAYVAIR